MKIENEKIVEATDKELFQNYLNDAWFLLMGYDTYKEQCKLNGTKIIDEEKPTQGRRNGKIQEIEIKLRKRYYSAFQVMEAVNQVCPEEWLKIAERLGKAETNDAVPVVRCKDCKWFNPEIEFGEIRIGTCPYQPPYEHTHGDGYCFRGVRREGEVEDNG